MPRSWFIQGYGIALLCIVGGVLTWVTMPVKSLWPLGLVFETVFVMLLGNTLATLSEAGWWK